MEVCIGMFLFLFYVNVKSVRQVGSLQNIFIFMTETELNNRISQTNELGELAVLKEMAS